MTKLFVYTRDAKEKKKDSTIMPLQSRNHNLEIFISLKGNLGSRGQ